MYTKFKVTSTFTQRALLAPLSLLTTKYASTTTKNNPKFLSHLHSFSRQYSTCTQGFEGSILSVGNSCEDAL